MTVQDLRETLTQLVGLLRAADAKAATTRGLTEFIESTAGFGDLSLGAFVKLAEAGRSPAAPRATPRPKGRAASDPDTVAAEVKRVYDAAADPAVTEEQIQQVCGRLGPLTKATLVKVAEGVGLVGMGAKKKDDIVSRITTLLQDRKGAAIRRQLLDRPPEPAGSDARASGM